MVVLLTVSHQLTKENARIYIIKKSVNKINALGYLERKSINSRKLFEKMQVNNLKLVG